MQELGQGKQPPNEEDEKLRRQIQIIKEEMGIKSIEKWVNIVIVIFIIIAITIGYIKYKAFQTVREEMRKPFIQEMDKKNNFRQPEKSSKK